MGPTDAGLDEDVVGGEIGAADAVVGAASGPADGDDHELADRNVADRWPDLDDTAQRFVAKDEVVVALGRAAVLPCGEVGVRAAQSGAHDLHAGAATVGDCHRGAGAATSRRCTESGVPGRMAMAFMTPA